MSYFDASGSAAAVDAATARWNRSGARVRIERARERGPADVVFVAAGEELRESCGPRCLGLRHREGVCSLMNAHAYDDGCSFTAGAAEHGPLPCGPATADVAAAARLYGRSEGARPCR